LLGNVAQDSDIRLNLIPEGTVQANTIYGDTGKKAAEIKKWAGDQAGKAMFDSVATKGAGGAIKVGVGALGKGLGLAKAVVAKAGVPPIALLSRAAPRAVGYLRNDLSRLAAAYRKANGVVGATNVAVFEYETKKGLKTISRSSERGVGHAERIVAKALEDQGIKPEQVRRIYSELEPCDIPGGYCDNFIKTTYPQADVTYTYPYPADSRATRQESIEKLRSAAERAVGK
jgi:hypothetical protein